MKVDAPTHEERENALCKERQHWPWEPKGYIPKADFWNPHPVSSDNNDNWKPQSLPWKVTEPQIDGEIVPFIPVPPAPLRYDHDNAFGLPGDYSTSKEDWKAFHAIDSRNDYVPKPVVEQEMQSANVDRRVENIVLSLDNYDPTIELFGGKYFINKKRILELYNTDLMNYTPITRFQLRASLGDRILSKNTEKIDTLIQKMLFRTMHPIDDKIIAAMDKTAPEHTEKFSPGLFLYVGTRRIKLPKEDMQLKQKVREHQRAALIRYAQDHPQRFAYIDRKYNVGNEIKTITFAFAYNKIYFKGEELDNKFENFFLSEAIKRGHIEKTEEAKESFLSRFRQLRGYITNPSVAAAFYMWQNGVKEPV